MSKFNVRVKQRTSEISLRHSCKSNRTITCILWVPWVNSKFSLRFQILQGNPGDRCACPTATLRFYGRRTSFENCKMNIVCLSRFALKSASRLTVEARTTICDLDFKFGKHPVWSNFSYVFLFPLSLSKSKTGFKSPCYFKKKVSMTLDLIHLRSTLTPSLIYRFF